MTSKLSLFSRIRYKVFMIIECVECNKKFDVDSSLIPDIGRLLECSICNHKWFFKKDIIKKSITLNEKDISINNNVKANTEINPDVQNFQENKHSEYFDISDPAIKNENLKENKDRKKFNILYGIIVFLISFIALILILDTFKTPLEKIFPNIEFILYNLYESIKDIELFFRDLT
jgi:predicted Zn finger-like uncharacterized protein